MKPKTKTFCLTWESYSGLRLAVTDFNYLNDGVPSNNFPRPSVRLLLTKTHLCSFLCPLRSRTAVSLSNNPQPRQASALTGPSSC